MSISSKIILSLDHLSIKDSIVLIQKIIEYREEVGEELVWGFCVNTLVHQEGIHFVSFVVDKGFNIMANIKLFDTRENISKLLNLYKHAGAKLVTVSATSVYFPEDHQKELACVINMLSYFDDVVNKTLSKTSIGKTIVNSVTEATIAMGYDNIICTSHDLENYRRHFKGILICDLIKQDYTLTPYGAVAKGADLVLLNDVSSLETLKRINKEFVNEEYTAPP